MLAKPKKSLGQNFLIDKNIRKKIIDACGLTRRDCVLEIGAGRGELTSLIAQYASSVYALEIDSALSRHLEDGLRDYANTKIINENFLNFNLPEYFGESQNKIKVIGNIPYYISSPIIERLLKFKDKIEVIFLTVQKEFGIRLAAPPGSKDYGSFSCFVQYHAVPKILFSIKRTSFYPAPKIDSCFLKMDIRSAPAVKVEDEEYLFKVIRASFNKRRKILKNSLKGIISEERLKLFFERYKISPNIRCEDLSLDDFAGLINL